MGKFDTAIFDLDGTLMNTLSDLQTAVAYALGSDFDTVTEEVVLHNVNFGVRHLMEGAAKEIGLSLSEDELDKVMDKFIAKYDECYADRTALYDGMENLLVKLKKDGLAIAVFSNKADQFVKHLCDCKIPKGLVDHARGEIKGIPAKPNPDGAFLAMKALGREDKSKVAYIGDSDIDVMTAKNAGFYCIGVSWGYRDEELLVKTGADIIAHSADELYEIISK